MSLKTSEIAIVLWEKVSPEIGIYKFEDMLIENEEVELAYKAKKDRLIFTNKRILIINIQGITGKTVEFHTVSYSKITSYSLEISSTFDSELKIWISGLAGIKMQFIKDIAIKEVDQYLITKIV